MSEHPLGVPTWTAVTCACALAIGLGAWGVAGSTSARHDVSPSRTASSSEMATAPAQSFSTSPSATPSAGKAFDSSSANRVLLTAADSTSKLQIDSPSVRKVTTDKALYEMTGGHPKTFTVDNKNCVPLLLSGGSVWTLGADPAPSDTVYLMQDQIDSDNDSDLAVSQSSRWIGSQHALNSYISALKNGTNKCEEAMVQTSKDAEPISQSVYPVKVTGSNYTVTAFILGVEGYSDSTAQAVLRRGNLITTVSVASSGASHKRLTKALAVAVSRVDARINNL